MTSMEFINHLKSKNISLSDIYDLLSFILSVSYNDAKKIGIVELDTNKTKSVLAKLENSIPTAYITSRREFYGNEFYIDSSVLIPRVESEIVVSEAIKLIRKNQIREIADLFTGSGALLLSLLAEESSLTGCGVDISSDALHIAHKNAKMLSLSERTTFFELDLSIKENIDQLFDKYQLIIANPPYISHLDYDGLDISVKKEPKIALVAKDDGLFYYNMLFCGLSVFRKKVTLVLEIGYDQSAKLTAAAGCLGLSFYFVKDHSAFDRVMVVEKTV